MVVAAVWWDIKEFWRVKWVGRGGARRRDFRQGFGTAVVGQEEDKIAAGGWKSSCRRIIIFLGLASKLRNANTSGNLAFFSSFCFFFL